MKSCNNNDIAKVLYYANRIATYPRLIREYANKFEDAFVKGNHFTEFYCDFQKSTFTEAVCLADSLLSEESDVIAFQNWEGFSEDADCSRELEQARKLYKESDLQGIRNKVLGHIVTKHTCQPYFRDGLVYEQRTNSLTNTIEMLNLTFMKYSKMMGQPYEQGYFAKPVQEANAYMQEMFDTISPRLSSKRPKHLMW